MKRHYAFLILSQVWAATGKNDSIFHWIMGFTWFVLAILSYVLEN